MSMPCVHGDPTFGVFVIRHAFCGLRFLLLLTQQPGTLHLDGHVCVQSPLEALVSVLHPCQRGRKSAQHCSPLAGSRSPLLIERVILASIMVFKIKTSLV